MSQQKTIDILRPAAVAVGGHFAGFHGYEPFHRWYYDQNQEFFSEAWVDDDKIEYRCNDGSAISLLNIKVATPAAKDIEISPIRMVGDSELVRAHIISTTNYKEGDIERKITFTDHSSTIDNIAQEVGVEVALGFKQSVGYGSEAYGIKGETEITASVKAAYKRHWETTVGRQFTIESERRYLELGRHKTIFDRVESVGPAEQTIKVRGKLEFGVEFHVDGVILHQWQTRRTMLANLKGIHNDEAWEVGHYRHHNGPGRLRNSNDMRIFDDFYGEVEYVRRFDHATNTEVVVREEPLD